MDLFGSVVDGVLGSAAGKAFDAVSNLITGSSSPKTSAGTAGESSVVKPSGSASSTETATSASNTSSGTGFEAILQGLLTGDATGQVSEEQLFAGVVGERVTTLKGKELGEKYKKYLEQERAVYTSDEAAAKAALRDMRKAGDLTAEETDKIYSEAFAAAQLKDKPTAALYDSYGGAGDPTIAVDTQASAISKAQDKIKQMDDGTLKFDTRSIDEGEATKDYIIQAYSANPTYAGQLNGTSSVAGTSTGVVSATDPSSAASLAEQLSEQAVDGKLSTAQLAALLPPGIPLSALEIDQDNGGGPYFKPGQAYAAGTVNQVATHKNNGTYTGGFLWKPVGDNSHRLTVLAVAGPGRQYDVTSVVLKDQNGNVIEEGVHTDPQWGFHISAGRKFDFTKVGSAYPKNLTVEVTLANGARIDYKIPDGSQRWS